MEKLKQFPIHKDQTCMQRRALMAAILMVVVSIIGLLFPQSLYPGEGQRDAYLVNDLVNILIGLPGILLALYLTKKGRLLGLLLLPGAVLYIFYTYIAYLFGVDFSLWSIAFAVLVIVSGVLFFRLIFNLNATAIKNCLHGQVPAIISGVLLAVFGAAFAFLAFDILTASKLPLPPPDLGLALADITVSLIWLTGGVLLLVKKPAGFAWGLGLLYAAVLLFIAVIVLVIVRPWLTTIPFAMDEVVTLGGMALLCCIPFGLFVRGVIKKEQE